VVGLHTTSPENTSRSGAVNIDQHGDQSPDPQKNLAAALGWFDELLRRGFHPLLTSGNGKGGYHLRVIFREPVPTCRVYTLMSWLVRDYALYGLTAAPETFPRQAFIPPGGCGNWLRLPGRHHTQPCWPAVWNGSTWLDGHAAIDLMLSLAGDPPKLLPPIPDPPPRRPFAQCRRDHADGGGRLSNCIARYMSRLPHLNLGQGRDKVAYQFVAFLVRDMAVSDDIALEWLSIWDAGNSPPKGRDRLIEIIENAHTYGKRAYASGLSPKAEERTSQLIITPSKRPGHFMIRSRMEVRS
jgi:hypothetical protein